MKPVRLDRSNMNTSYLKNFVWLFAGGETDRYDYVCSALKQKYNFLREESFIKTEDCHKQYQKVSNR